MYVCTVSKADERARYFTLSAMEVGGERRHGGGALSYTLQRKYDRYVNMDIEEEAGEKAAVERTLREGYDPGRAFREDTVIWSWNCQMANPTRLRTWHHESKTRWCLCIGQNLRPE